MSLTTTIQAIQVKWSLWKFATPVVFNGLFSIACYVIGWHLSTNESAMPLARSGAAATMASIAFTLYDYRRALDLSEAKAFEKFANMMKNFQLTGNESLGKIGEKLQQNTLRVSQRITSVQVAILIFATFVWGFGDLAKPWM